MIYDAKFILGIGLCCVSYSAFDSPARSLTLALMRCPYDAIGSLPGLVIVEWCTALTVVTSCVVSANTLAMDLPGKQNKQTKGNYLELYCIWKHVLILD